MEDIYIDIINKINRVRSQSGGQRWNLICNDICDLYFILIKDEEDLLYTKDELWDFLFNQYLVDSPQYTKYLNICKNNKKNNIFFCRIVTKAIEDPPAEWWNTQIFIDN